MTYYVAFCSQDSVLNNDILDQIKFIYECMKEDFETSSLSTLNSDKFQWFLTHTQLTIRSVDFSGKNSKRKDIPPYKWSDLAENHKKQQEKIIGYLNWHLKPHLPNINIVDVVNNKELSDT